MIMTSKRMKISTTENPLTPLSGRLAPLPAPPTETLEERKFKLIQTCGLPEDYRRYQRTISN